MKKLKIGLLAFALLMFGITFTSCNNSDSKAKESTEATMETSDTDEAEMDKSGPEYTSAYVCPMHCKGSGSAEAGKCPVCGMDYVMNEDAADEGDADSMNEGEEGEGDQSDGDGHEGHNHG